MGRVFFPSVTWLLLAVWVAPAIAALGLGVMVVASSRVSSLQAANQIGSLLVLPLVLLMIVQTRGVLLFTPMRIIVWGAITWAIAALLLLAGMQGLRRQRMAVRL